MIQKLAAPIMALLGYQVVHFKHLLAYILHLPKGRVHKPMKRESNPSAIVHP